MDKFNLLYNELACNFGVGTEPFRGPFKAALDAYIEERVNAMVEHCPIRLPDTPVKPVEGKNAVVSAEGNRYLGVDLQEVVRIIKAQKEWNPVTESMRHMEANEEAIKPKTVPLPVVGRCKDCKHWERIGRYGKCNNVIVEGGAHEADFSDVNVQGKFIVGESFGCVHFDPTTQPKCAREGGNDERGFESHLTPHGVQ